MPRQRALAQRRNIGFVSWTSEPPQIHGFSDTNVHPGRSHITPTDTNERVPPIISHSKRIENTISRDRLEDSVRGRPISIYVSIALVAILVNFESATRELGSVNTISI